MKIAKVIVDVSAMPLNQTFDYLIPKNLVDVVQKGVRVLIPFGARKITGFVVGLSDSSDVQNLREIIDVLDVTPVLTEELLHLGKWLAEETLCFYVTAYHAMLPNALKANYQKKLVRLTDEPLVEPFCTLFNGNSTIDYEQALDAKIHYTQLKQLIEDGKIEIQYVVRQKQTKKYETWLEPALAPLQMEEVLKTLPKNAVRQKQIIEFFVNRKQAISQKELFDKLGINRTHVKTLLDKNILKEKYVEKYRDPYAHYALKKGKPFRLTEEQRIALQKIIKPVEKNKHAVVLVHGITGSGKTEIYLQAIEKVLTKGKEAIVLVPEISLTPMMVKRFKERFGKKVAVLHSALSSGEKYDEWRKIHRKEVKVVVGARSAIFAPFENLGIIIIDEEHETSYKQEEQPRYHAKDVAIYRARTYQCPVVLGSATPTLESYARAKKGVYELVTLKKRTNERPMPTVEVVDMRTELHAGNRSMFSRLLQEKMDDRIQKGEQIVLLLNRRGYSTFVMCRDCGHVCECPSCDISLTYHKSNQSLKCHYCLYQEQVPKICPTCSSSLIRFFGTGTQKVEEALKNEIEDVSIIRMDVDTTRRKGAHERLLAKFARKEANVLLGTQMIAKGLDFPNVTLVGVLAADSILHLPDFRSAEKTFQLLTQVSGRAGRHELPGEVVIQTYTPDHYSIQHAGAYDYESFYMKEMSLRHTFQYPPYVYLALITISHMEQAKVLDVSRRVTRFLQDQLSNEAIILGPSPSPVPKVNNRFRYQCMIKYKNEPNLKKVIQKLLFFYTDDIQKSDLQIIVDFNPYQLM